MAEKLLDILSGDGELDKEALDELYYELGRLINQFWTALGAENGFDARQMFQSLQAIDDDLEHMRDLLEDGLNNEESEQFDEALERIENEKAQLEQQINDLETTSSGSSGEGESQGGR
ncbi:MAG: hypothetical protein ETSY1_33545 [Candidatus Entotheonella factor]|uniref:Uncharacterized protein n=1 Tax=Entotheonella factor TaxID=1429438 RepID=W4LA16_ENTF1|nr:MAG: hypothetical protein ETSY1_33545 [Candidatus Entotheonella factor]